MKILTIFKLVITYISILLLLTSCYTEHTPKNLLTSRNLVSIHIIPAEMMQTNINHLKLAAGNLQQFTAIGTYTDNTSKEVSSLVDWEVLDLNNSSITHTGLFLGKAPTNTVIHASINGINSNYIKIEVTDAIINTIEISPESITLAQGSTVQLTATAIYSDNTTADITASVFWKSSDIHTATIQKARLLTSEQAGLLTAHNTGNIQVSITKDGITSNSIDIEVTGVSNTETTNLNK